MRLDKFRIQNYKSIKDTGYCWLATDITILAGKNESGKTAILEALRDFNTDVKELPEESISLEGNGDTLIELCFNVEKKFIKTFEEKIKHTLNKEVIDYLLNKGLTLYKNEGGGYWIEEELEIILDSESEEDILPYQDILQEVSSKIYNLREYKPFDEIEEPNLENISISVIKNAIKKFIDDMNDNFDESRYESEKLEEIKKLINEIKQKQKILDDKKAYMSDIFVEKIKEEIPFFIFFSDFSSILPYELPFSEAVKHEAVLDFAEVAGLDMEKVINTTDTQRRKNMLISHSALLSGDFMEYWDQSQIELISDHNADNLIIAIKEAEKDIQYQMKQRSKGLQWFISFYLRLKARQKEKNVLLVDEPGLYLHAKAQKDVLKVLENISKKSKVIYSTHSPYLIDANRLDRVKLVLKDNMRGSYIENKIHKGADIDTLTPIMTAIGIDLSSEFSIAGNFNILLEGISDYYYLQAMKAFLPHIITKKVHFIAATGAQTIKHFVSLMIGWGLDFCVILDNDQAGRKTEKLLRTKLDIKNDLIIFVSKEKDFCIEDLFSHIDFKKYIIKNIDNISNDTKISKYLKGPGVDEVLISKKFLEKVIQNKSEIKLTNQTIANFTNIFKQIDAVFENSS